jgi:hypothetical protein
VQGGGATTTSQLSHVIRGLERKRNHLILFFEGSDTYLCIAKSIQLIHPVTFPTLQRSCMDQMLNISAPNGWVSPNFNEELPYPVKITELPYPGLGKYILDQVELVRLTRGGSKNSLTQRGRVLYPEMLQLPLIP